MKEETMNELKHLKEILDVGIDTSWEEMRTELRTEDNSDYRRGFVAGMLCGRLQLKSDISDVEQLAVEIIKPEE